MWKINCLSRRHIESSSITLGKAKCISIIFAIQSNCNKSCYAARGRAQVTKTKKQRSKDIFGEF